MRITPEEILAAGRRRRKDRESLAWRNRVIAAERWPEGVLEMCIVLEAAHEGWAIWWLAANDIKGWERPAGYCARRQNRTLVGGDELRRLPEDGVRRHISVFSPNIDELKRKIEAVEERVAEEAYEQALRRHLNG